MCLPENEKCGGGGELVRVSVCVCVTIFIYLVVFEEGEKYTDCPGRYL